MMTENTSSILKDRQVLLIEDDEVNLMLLDYMLRKVGADVAVKFKKDEITAHLREKHTDLIVLDTALSSFNAFNFTKKMREEMKIQIPIIGMSVNNLRGRGIYHGLDQVLSKPVEYRKLYEALENLGFKER